MNPQVLGVAADAKIELLLPAGEGLIEPTEVSPVTVDGKYQSFALKYPRSVGFESARAALNQLYGSYEMPNVAAKEKTASWRHTEFTIHLTEELGAIHVVYVHRAERKEARHE